MSQVQIQSKADRDRLRQRVSQNRKLVDQVRRLLKEYRQGRAASAVLSDMERLMGMEVKR